MARDGSGAPIASSGIAVKIEIVQGPLPATVAYSELHFPMTNSYGLFNFMIGAGAIIPGIDDFAIVELPSYFDALNIDFRYQLTVIGEFAQAIVKEEISGNHFTIQTDKPNVKVSWQVTGVRNDVWARENRIQAEVDKPAIEKGLFLHPELYGESKDMGMKKGIPGHEQKQHKASTVKEKDARIAPNQK